MVKDNQPTFNVDIETLHFKEKPSDLETINNGPIVMHCLKRIAISFLRIHGKKNIAEVFRNLWAKPRLKFNVLITL